jgi:hypothetical protein
MNIETKRCPKCERKLPIDDFNKRKDGRTSSYCRACQSLYSRNHYVANRADYNARRYQIQPQLRARNRAYVVAHLRLNPCVDCGEADPILLEFDHIDRATKEFTVADLIRRASSLARIQREIDFCVVRCAHCHRRRTAVQFGWNTACR